MTNGRAKAVIYARVSSAKQVKEGDGIASQITRCRMFAQQRGYDIGEVFTDDMSGSVLSRPGMKALLAHLKKSKHSIYVIIDDISRLARSLETHIALRLAIKNAGGVLESPSIEFGDSSDSILVENLLASVSQHHRQKNGETTKNRMVARMMNGYWSFRSPVGFRFARAGAHGKMLHRDEPVASVIQEAYEGYASGRFDGFAEIMRFLKAHPSWPSNKRKTLTVERVAELMSRPHYAGFIHAPEWGIVMLKGKHEPIVSLETYEKVQQRIKDRSKTFTRLTVNEEFPLRGYVTCSDCGDAYTACFSTGRTARYPYYLCQTKGCLSYGRSVRREVMEVEFETLLKSLRPAPELFELASVMFRDLWNARISAEATNAKSLVNEAASIERQIEKLMDRIVETDTPSLIPAYESRVQNLTMEKARLSEKIAQCGRPLSDFDTTYRTAMGFLQNPYDLWSSERLTDKRTVLKMAFAEPIGYDRKTGFRTPKTAVPFNIFSELHRFESDDSRMVPRRGLANPTPETAEIRHFCERTVVDFVPSFVPSRTPQSTSSSKRGVCR